jgi:hypothetical protein
VKIPEQDSYIGLLWEKYTRYSQYSQFRAHIITSVSSSACGLEQVLKKCTPYNRYEKFLYALQYVQLYAVCTEILRSQGNFYPSYLSAVVQMPTGRQGVLITCDSCSDLSEWNMLV